MAPPSPASGRRAQGRRAKGSTRPNNNAKLTTKMTSARGCKFHPRQDRRTLGSLFERWKSLYENGPLEAKLKGAFAVNGRLDTLEPRCLKTLLLVVTKNLTTDSAWPISSNPNARYNDPASPQNNLKIPLWQIVRASTAAPVYFPPEVV